MTSHTSDFHVALAPDFSPDGSGKVPRSYGLQRLLSSRLSTRVAPWAPTIDSSDFGRYDAMLLMDQVVDADALATASRTRLLARYGVGTDAIDLDACTRRGVMVTVTPEGVTRPVASAALTLVLTTTHRLVEKARILKAADWAVRGAVVGMGLTNRTVGIIGLGRTGRELARLVQPFGARLVGYDPYVGRDDVADLDVELIDVDSVVEQSDVLCLLAVLTPETFHLVDAARIARMKPGAIVINVSRGQLIEEAALVHALQNGQLGGAGLDVFEEEPLAEDSPLVELSRRHNVVLTPHSLCWTDECFEGNGGSASQAILDFASGRVPQHVANPAVLGHPNFAAMTRAA